MTDTPESKRRWYVTMTWDNWPEGGSFGTIVPAENEDAAKELCRFEMAQTREDEDTTAGEIREMYEDQWHTVDCFPLDEFIDHLQKKATEV